MEGDYLKHVSDTNSLFSRGLQNTCAKLLQLEESGFSYRINVFMYCCCLNISSSAPDFFVMFANSIFKFTIFALIYICHETSFYRFLPWKKIFTSFRIKIHKIVSQNFTFIELVKNNNSFRNAEDWNLDN